MYLQHHVHQLEVKVGVITSTEDVLNSYQTEMKSGTCMINMESFVLLLTLVNAAISNCI
jgi:hypothetical protein